MKKKQKGKVKDENDADGAAEAEDEDSEKPKKARRRDERTRGKAKDSGGEAEDSHDKRKGRRKRKKLVIIVAVVIIIIVLIVGLWGMQEGKSYPGVGEIVKNQDKYLNDYIEVKGTVKEDSINSVNKTFRLTDGTYDLNVTHEDMPPANFEEGKDVVVKGKLYLRPGGLVLEAEEIVIGCASKY